MPSAGDALPAFIPPMLARIGDPFDSDEHVFEIKWDGTRSLAFVDDGGLRLRNRKDRDMVPRYPDLAGLAALPSGTVLDGEIVILESGRASFSGMLKREQATTPLKVAAAANALPATYVAFDLLYRDHRSLLGESLATRREALADLLAPIEEPRLVPSDGVVGPGRAFFDAACEQDLEGIVAKRLDSPYLPGKRTDAWQKIKKSTTALCVIMGFLTDEAATGAGARDVRSLVVALEQDGVLSCVGRVGSGLTDRAREDLRDRLWPLVRPEPIIPSRVDAVWVEPQIFCRVRYLERTEAGDLRAPVFLGLVDERGRPILPGGQP